MGLQPGRNSEPVALWQHSDGVLQRVEADGNWLRQTDGKIRDQAITRKVEAQGNQRLIGPKNHAGSELGNLIKVLVDTLDLLQEMNEQIAVHPAPGKSR